MELKVRHEGDFDLGKVVSKVYRENSRLVRTVVSEDTGERVGSYAVWKSYVLNSNGNLTGEGKEYLSERSLDIHPVYDGKGKIVSVPINHNDLVKDIVSLKSSYNPSS